MPIKSRWSLEAHHVSIPTFIFGSCSEPLDTSTKIFLDAKRPSTHYFTLESFREWSKRFAEGLTVAGLEQGDRVTLFSGNNIFTPVVVMGVIMAGGTYSSANPAYTPRELANQLRDSKPRFVLAADNCVDRALQATNIIGMPAASIFFFEDLPIQTVMNKPLVQPATTRCKHWATLLGTEEKSARFTWEELNTPELSAHTAVMVYSSGTTGLPKGVELTHFTLVSNMRQLMKVQLSDASIRERRGLCCLPMYHGLGLVYYVFIAPKARMQVVMMDRWHLASVLRCIEKYRITELVLVPPMVASIGADAGARSGQYDLSSVRKVLAGAAPLGLETTRQFEKLWGRRLKIRQAWGMSESPVITLCWDECDKSTNTSASVGELLPGVEAMLMDEDGKEALQSGQRGEMWLRGPNRMKGYWGNPKATAETITKDGWLQTGDIAYRDSSGKFYIVDRKKELIKVRGAQVAPAEIEALLLECPKVADARRENMTDSNKKDVAVSADEVADFVNSRVSKLKRLTGGVVFVKSVPRNPSGKILRKELRELAAKNLAAHATGRARL